MTRPPPSSSLPRRAAPCPKAIGALVATGLMLALPAAAQGLSAPRQTLGIYDGWGAFRVARGGGGGAVCYAIATPGATVGPRAGAFLSIATWRDGPPRAAGRRGKVAAIIARGQVYVRLSRPAARADALRMVVGDVAVPLVTRGVHAWTTSPAGDARVRAAMRAATSLSITGPAGRGRSIADTYRLSGAASAIDAATLGCAGA